jgi:hypothetical protein
MRIHMLHTRAGSEDGFSVKFYERGQSYEVSELLGGILVSKGAASIERASPQPEGE